MPKPTVKEIEAEMCRLLALQVTHDARDHNSVLYYGLYGADNVKPTSHDRAKVQRVAMRVAARLQARSKKLLGIP